MISSVVLCFRYDLLSDFIITRVDSFTHFCEEDEEPGAPVLRAHGEKGPQDTAESSDLLVEHKEDKTHTNDYEHSITAKASGYVSILFGWEFKHCFEECCVTGGTEDSLTKNFDLCNGIAAGDIKDLKSFPSTCLEDTAATEIEFSFESVFQSFPAICCTVLSTLNICKTFQRCPHCNPKGQHRKIIFQHL